MHVQVVTGDTLVGDKAVASRALQLYAEQSGVHKGDKSVKPILAGLLVYSS